MTHASSGNDRDSGGGMRFPPLCRCLKPLVNLEGVCTICGLERLHVKPKVQPLRLTVDEQDNAA